MNKPKRIYLVLGAILIVGFISCVAIYAWRQEAKRYSYHVYCELVIPGMTKEQVFEILSRLGEYRVIDGGKIGDLQDIEIDFKNPIILLKLDRMYLTFEDSILKWSSRRAGISDRAPGADCKNPP